MHACEDSDFSALVLLQLLLAVEVALLDVVLVAILAALDLVGIFLLVGHRAPPFLYDFHDIARMQLWVLQFERATRLLREKDERTQRALGCTLNFGLGGHIFVAIGLHLAFRERSWHGT